MTDDDMTTREQNERARLLGELAEARQEIERLCAEVADLRLRLAASEELRRGGIGARVDGSDACIEGRPIDSCPHEPDGARADHWQQGWTQESEHAEVERLRAKVERLTKTLFAAREAARREVEQLRAALWLVAHEEAFCFAAGCHPFLVGPMALDPDSGFVLAINVGDTFAYATADCEPFGLDQAPHLVRLMCDGGWQALVRWVAEHRGESPLPVVEQRMDEYLDALGQARREVERLREENAPDEQLRLAMEGMLDLPDTHGANKPIAEAVLYLREERDEARREVDRLRGDFASRDAMDVAELAGIAARLDGVSRESCPHADEDLAECWRAGWDDQEVTERLRAEVADLRALVAAYQTSILEQMRGEE